MIQNTSKTLRKREQGPVANRQRHRLRPTLLALEERTLLSTFTVNSTADDGSSGTLRWAIGQANSTGGAETIQFDPTVFATPQTITLGGTQLELSDTTGTETITGTAGLTISGGGVSRVFEVDAGVTASITGLTITDGNTSGNGGGVYDNGGDLTLTDCTVSGNTSGVNGPGVYIYDGGQATLTNSKISGNSGYQGGIFNSGGTVSIEG